MPPPWHSPPRCRPLACAFEPSRLGTHPLAQAYELLVPSVRRRLPGPAAAPAATGPDDGRAQPYPYRVGGTSA